MSNGRFTTEQLAAQIRVTKRTIERNISSLQKKGRLERVGSKKDGSWTVIR